MVENFSEFLSIIILVNMLLIAFYFLAKVLAKRRRKRVIKRELDYYREIY